MLINSSSEMRSPFFFAVVRKREMRSGCDVDLVSCVSAWEKRSRWEEEEGGGGGEEGKRRPNGLLLLPPPPSRHRQSPPFASSTHPELRATIERAALAFDHAEGKVVDDVCVVADIALGLARLEEALQLPKRFDLCVGSTAVAERLARSWVRTWSPSAPARRAKHAGGKLTSRSKQRNWHRSKAAENACVFVCESKSCRQGCVRVRSCWGGGEGQNEREREREREQNVNKAERLTIPNAMYANVSIVKA